MKRKPKIEYYWGGASVTYPVVHWRLVGGNGEIMCQSTQGFRDKTDAQRSVFAVIAALVESWAGFVPREVGPGRKPVVKAEGDS
jgi:hypothetical protein